MSADDHSPDAVKKHIPVYLTVGAILFVGTIITVAARYLELSNVVLTVVIAVLIASVKSSFVAGVFMHLKGEKKIIWYTLFLTGVFFLVLMVLPVWTTEESVGEKVAPKVHFRAYDPDAHGAGHGEKKGKKSHAQDEHAEESEEHETSEPQETETAHEAEP
jgi:caa(3)-type oxidase subunit IV